MKRKIFILNLFIAFFFLAGRSHAQPASYYMYLISNLNEHFSPTLYSACWGYSASDNREYAILGCPGGISFVDITDTANVHEVGYFPTVNSAWHEMKTYSHYAYIVTDVVGGAQGVQIVDLQYLPDSIHFVRNFTFSGFSQGHTISQSGPYLYVNGGNYSNAGIFVLDLTVNPELPVKRGEWEDHYVHDCRVVNDTIWACNIYNPPGTISVINATNKDNLQNITSWVDNPQPGPHNCALTPDRNYCLVCDEIGGNPRLMKIWNISNLSNVLLVAMWQPTNITTSIAHNVEVYHEGNSPLAGTYALVAHYTAGVRLVSLYDRATPQEAAWYDTYPPDNSFSYNGCWGVYMFPSGKIIASDRQTGLYVLSLDRSLTGTHNERNAASKFSLGQNYPNPFNPATTIKYTLVKNSYAVLKVYDVLGKQIGIIVDGYEMAGEHSVSYDASRLASGIYYYTLESGGFFETKKMTLLK